MGGDYNEEEYKLSLIPKQTPQSYSFDTTVIGKDETYTFYEATTDSFSTFAITGIKSISTNTATTTGLSGLTTEVTVTPEVTETAPGKAPPVRLVVISVVIILMALAVMLYIKRK